MLEKKIAFGDKYEWAFVDGPTSQGQGFYNYHLLAMSETQRNARRSEYIHSSDISYFNGGMQRFTSQHMQIDQLFMQLRAARESDADDDEIRRITSRFRPYYTMRCFEPLSDPKGPSFRGLWKLTYEYDVMLEQHSGTLTGKVYSLGECVGTIEGRIHNSNIQGSIIIKKENDNPPPNTIDETMEFSLSIDGDEIILAGELRTEDGERIICKADRLNGLHPDRIKEIKNKILQQRWKEETYESWFHGLAEDAVKLPRKLFGTEEGGPIFQPSKVVDAIYDWAKEDGVKKVSEKVADEFEDLIEDESELGNPIYKDANPERYQVIKEGLEATKDTVEETTKQIGDSLFSAIEQRGIKDPRDLLLDSYRALYEGSKEEVQNEVWDGIKEEVEKGEIEWDVGVDCDVNLPKLKGDIDEDFAKLELYVEQATESYGLSLIDDVGIEVEAKLPKGDKISLGIGLENPTRLFMEEFTSLDPWKGYAELKVETPKLEGVEMRLKGYYGEENAGVELSIEIPLEREHRPYRITMPDEDTRKTYLIRKFE